MDQASIMVSLLMMLLSQCLCNPVPDDRTQNEDKAGRALVQASRQLSTSLFAQFLTSFPFFLTSPIQNLIPWIWSIQIWLLILFIIGVAVVRYIARKKLRKVKSKKYQAKTEQNGETSSALTTNMFSGLDANTLMACASCPLLLPLLQGMGNMPYGYQTLPYVNQPAALPHYPVFPEIQFPELPPSTLPVPKLKPQELPFSEPGFKDLLHVPKPAQEQADHSPPQMSLPPPDGDIILSKPDLAHLPLTLPPLPVQVQPIPQYSGPYSPYEQYSQNLKPDYNPARFGTIRSPNPSHTAAGKTSKSKTVNNFFIRNGTTVNCTQLAVELLRRTKDYITDKNLRPKHS